MERWEMLMKDVELLSVSMEWYDGYYLAPARGAMVKLCIWCQLWLRYDLSTLYGEMRNVDEGCRIALYKHGMVRCASLRTHASDKISSKRRQLSIVVVLYGLTYLFVYVCIYLYIYTHALSSTGLEMNVNTNTFLSWALACVESER